MSKIYIHPFTYLLVILSVVTGMFKEFFYIFVIIIVHEVGHIFISYIFKWNFYKVAIYPFGGCVKFDEKINRPIYEELFILFGGPLFQVILFFFVYFLATRGIISFRNYLIFKNYHYTLLIFNLLPIYPLDGGRLLNLIFNYFFPYKIGNYIQIFLSFLFLFFLLFFYNSLNYSLMIVLLLVEVTMYLKNQGYLYNKFLLERYIGNYSFSSFKVIKNKNGMFRDKRHILFLNDRYITEKEFLNDKFKVIR